MYAHTYYQNEVKAFKYDGLLQGCNYRAPSITRATIKNQFNDQSPPLQILDAACGTGLMARELRKIFPSATIHGTDNSPQMKQIAVEKKRIDSFKYANLAFDKLAFEDNSMDLVTCIGAMEFIGNEKHAISEMARVLKPGGLLASTFRKPDSDYSAIRSYFWLLPPLAFHDRNSIIRSFLENSLDIVETKEFTGYENCYDCPVYTLAIGRKIGPELKQD